MLDRRQLLKLVPAAGLATGLAKGSEPGLKAAEEFKGLESKHPAAGIVTSLNEEHNYIAEIEGDLPLDLQGTLFRNGPGLFERDGVRKAALVDGDGMIRAYRFENGQVRFENKYIQTEKFVEEQAAGEYVYPTWTTRAPGGMWSNIMPDMKSQAGITAVYRGDRLFAFDESTFPHEIDPKTLETLGVAKFELPSQETTFAAHSKVDPINGEWIHYGIQYGKDIKAHINIFDKGMKGIHQQVVTLPTYPYIHDFLITKNYIIFILGSTKFNPASFLFGLKAMAKCIQWVPEQGNRVVIIPRYGDGESTILEAPPSFLWHTVNAYEDGEKIIADFVGYDDPDHFIGEEAGFYALMEGKEGNFGAPGTLRRYQIDLSAKTLSEEVLKEGMNEFPMLNPDCVGREYRYTYMATHPEPGLLTGICRVDVSTGKAENFDFGPRAFIGEPIFIKAGDSTYEAGSASEPGYVITEGYDGDRKLGFLAIFDAEDISQGPVATVWMKHHLPLAFHGCWAPSV